MADRKIEALEILKKYNPLRNDLDAYLFEICEWGLSRRTKKPKAKYFGIEEKHLDNDTKRE